MTSVASLRPQRCIGCGIPSTTARCADCSTRVESDGHARNRYRGRGKRGRQPWWREDLSELGCAIEAAAKARDAIETVAMRADLTALERDHALIEPLAQVGLAGRHLTAVLERYGVAAGERPDNDDAFAAACRAADVELEAEDVAESKSAYAIRYEARKLAGACVRCGRPALSESLYCAECLVSQRMHVRRSVRRLRRRKRYEEAERQIAAERAKRKNVKQRVKQRRIALGTQDRPRVPRSRRGNGKRGG